MIETEKRAMNPTGALCGTEGAVKRAVEGAVIRARRSCLNANEVSDEQQRAHDAE